MSQSHLSFTEILNQRRSTRKYDPNKPVDSAVVKQCIEKATLAPNSSNMQLWEFHHVTDPKILKKLAFCCFDQGAAKTAQEMVVFVVRKDLWRKRQQAHVTYLTNLFGVKPDKEYSSREKFALNYYKKVMPLTYSDFFGIFGYIKYLMFWVVGLFRPIYRQARQSDMRIVAHKSTGLAAQTFMLAMTDAGYDTCPMEGHDSLRIKKLLNLPRRSEVNMVISCGVRLPEGIYGERFRIPFEEVYKQH